jgi:hypothetical protein
MPIIGLISHFSLKQESVLIRTCNFIEGGQEGDGSGGGSGGGEFSD